MWYTPTSQYNEPLPDRRGHQFGPLVLTKLDNQWQLDHWPSGLRVLPSSTFPFEHFGYNRLRRIASRLQRCPWLRQIHSNEAPRDILYAVRIQLEEILREVQ